MLRGLGLALGVVDAQRRRARYPLNVSDITHASIGSYGVDQLSLANRSINRQRISVYPETWAAYTLTTDKAT